MSGMKRVLALAAAFLIHKDAFGRGPRCRFPGSGEIARSTRMTSLGRVLSLAAVSLAVACNDNALVTAPEAGPMIVASVVSNLTDGPAVLTDKPDYVPGEPVMMYGAGWQPGEEVTLT